MPNGQITLITTREAAEYLRVTPETVRKYVRQGRLRALVAANGRVMVDWQDVVEMAPPDRLLRRLPVALLGGRTGEP